MPARWGVLREERGGSETVTRTRGDGDGSGRAPLGTAAGDRVDPAAAGTDADGADPHRGGGPESAPERFPDAAPTVSPAGDAPSPRADADADADESDRADEEALGDDDPTTAFRHLGPDRLLDAIDVAGWPTDGRVSTLNSYENRVYSVGLDAGGFVVAKFYRPGRWSDEQILEEHAFCHALAERDLPVVAPLADADGRTLFHADPFRLALYPRVGGRPPELDDAEQLHVVGRTLGRLHLVGDVHRFDSRPRIGVERLGRRSVEFLLDSALLPSAIVEAYDTLTRELLEIVEERFADAGGIDEISVHGDFHPGNLLIGGDGIPRLLDFDDTGTGPAVQDLWMFLSGERGYAQARLGDLLDGYHEFREFDERELRLIEPLRTLRMLRHAAWIARRWEDPAFRRGFPLFAEARFWDEHVLALREQRAALEERPLVY